PPLGLDGERPGDGGGAEGAFQRHAIRAGGRGRDQGGAGEVGKGQVRLAGQGVVGRHDQDLRVGGQENGLQIGGHDVQDGDAEVGAAGADGGEGPGAVAVDEADARSPSGRGGRRRRGGRGRRLRRRRG